MKLDKIKPKNETEVLIVSKTRNGETFIEQTHTKPEETVEFRLNQLKENFSFNLSIILRLDSEWMIGLTGLEVYIFIFNITDENNNFECYIIPDLKKGKFTDVKVRDEIEKDKEIPIVTAADLENGILGTIFFEE